MSTTWEILRFNGQRTPRLIQTRVALPTISVGPKFTLRTDQSPPAMPASLTNTNHTTSSLTQHRSAEQSTSTASTKVPIISLSNSSSATSSHTKLRLHRKTGGRNCGGSEPSRKSVMKKTGRLSRSSGALLKRPNIRSNGPMSQTDKMNSNNHPIPPSLSSTTVSFPVVLLYMVRGSPNSISLELRHGDRVEYVIQVFRQRLESDESTKKYLTMEWDFFAGDKFATKIASHTQILGPCTILAIADPSYKATTLERASKMDQYRNRAEMAENRLRNCLSKLGAIERDSQEQINVTLRKNEQERIQLTQRIEQLELINESLKKKLNLSQRDHERLNQFETETRKMIDILAHLHGLDLQLNTTSHHVSSDIVSLSENSCNDESTDVKTDGTSQTGSDDIISHNEMNNVSQNCTQRGGILKRRYSNMRDTDTFDHTQGGLNLVNTSERHSFIQQSLYDLAVLQWRPFYDILQWPKHNNNNNNNTSNNKSDSDIKYRIWSPECITLRSLVDSQWTSNVTSMDEDYYRNATITVSDDGNESELCDSPCVIEEIREYLVRNGENCVHPVLRGRTRKKFYDGQPFQLQSMPDDGSSEYTDHFRNAVTTDNKCLVSTKHIPKFTVLSQYVGGVYTRREYDLVFARSREETLRNMYAFDTSVETPMSVMSDSHTQTESSHDDSTSSSSVPHHSKIKGSSSSDSNNDEASLSTNSDSRRRSITVPCDDNNSDLNSRKIAKKNGNFGSMAASHCVSSSSSSSSGSTTITTDDLECVQDRSNQRSSAVISQTSNCTDNKGRTEIVIGGLGFINQKRSEVTDSQLTACRFVDCRKDISVKEMSVEDAHRYNVEFVTAHINGWPSIFCVARRRIGAGEILCAHFGDDYSATVIDHRDYLAKVQRVKEYLCQISSQNI